MTILNSIPARNNAAILGLSVKYLLLNLTLCAIFTLASLAADNVVHPPVTASFVSSNKAKPAGETCSESPGMPRYYLGTVEIIGDDGRPEKTDPDDPRVDGYLQAWRKKEELKGRILDTRPTKQCTAECPCDEVRLTESLTKKGESVTIYLDVKLLAQPPETHSKIEKNSFEIPTSLKGDVRNTRTALAKCAMASMASHDELHATAHEKAAASVNLQPGATNRVVSARRQEPGGEGADYAGEDEAERNGILQNDSN